MESENPLKKYEPLPRAGEAAFCWSYIVPESLQIIPTASEPTQYKRAVIIEHAGDDEPATVTGMIEPDNGALWLDVGLFLIILAYVTAVIALVR